MGCDLPKMWGPTTRYGLFRDLVLTVNKLMPEDRRIHAPDAQFYMGGKQATELLLDAAHPNTVDETREADDTFFLPFKSIWVEDHISGVALYSQSERRVGLSGSRYGIVECFTQTIDKGSAEPIAGVARAKKIPLPATMSVFRSTSLEVLEVRFPYAIAATILWFSSGLLLDGTPIDLKVATQQNVESEEMKALAKDALQSFQSVALQVMAINSPANLVIEERKPRVARRPDGKRRKSNTEDVRYIVLPRAEGHRLVAGKAMCGHSRAGHVRRRHFRTLRSSRYTEEKRGTKIVVKECWVGPQERVVGEVKYRVMLSLGLEDEVGATNGP